MRFISFLIFLSLIFSGVQAQNKENRADTTININDLVISSEKPGKFKPLIRVVSVMKSSEIEKSAVGNLPDIFRYIQGIDYKTRGNEGVQGDVNVLGGTFDQTMVFVNGINLTDPQTGHHSMNLPVEPSAVERIEVLQGPGAWSGGSIAYSGAVNIVTKNAENNSADISLTGGSYGYFKGGANGSFSGKLKGWKIGGLFAGSWTQSDGFTENTDFGTGNLYANISVSDKSGKNTLFIQGGYQQKAFGANSFYTFTYPEQFERISALFSSLQYIHENEGWKFSATIYQRRHYDKFELFRHEAPEWYTGHNYHRNDASGAELQAGIDLGKTGSLTVGTDLRSENIRSNVLGDPAGKQVPVPGEDNIFYTKVKARFIPSAYLKYVFQTEKLRLSAGTSLSETLNGPDFDNNYGTKLSFGAAAAYIISPGLEINAWANNSYRNPTFTDLYYKSPSQTGNASLMPEQAITGQLGIRYYKQNTSLFFSSFYRHGYRIIDWVRSTESEQWSASNLTDVNSAGFEMSIDHIMHNDFLKRAFLSYGYLYVVKQSGDLHSLYATDYLKHKLVVSAEHGIVKDLTATWSLLWQERAGTYLDLSLNECDYKPFALLNVKLLWKKKGYSLFFDVTNLTGTHYFDLGNLTQPGRWIKSGIILNLYKSKL
jgi:iron complex outermembrane receptor protein